MAKLASERSRSGLSPAVTSSWAAIWMPIPTRASSCGAKSGDQGSDQFVEGGDLLAEFEDPSGQALQRDPGGGHRVGGVGGGWPPRRAGADQPHPGQVPDLVPELFGGGDDGHPEQLQRGAAGPDRGLPGHSQHPQRLHRPVLGLRDADPAAVQRGPGGTDHVQLIVLAVAATVRPSGRSTSHTCIPTWTSCR